MNKTVYTNIFGTFMLKGSKIIAKKLFKDLDDRKNKQKYEKDFLKKPNIARGGDDFIFPKAEEYSNEFYKFNMERTKRDLISSVKKDNLLSQAINNIEELNKVINLLSKRLREWFGLYFPELNEFIDDNEDYATLVIEKSRDQLSKKFTVKTIGADLSREDVEQMKQVAKEIKNLASLREKEKKYIEKIMDDFCPNLKEVATATIGAELIEHARSLKNLAEMTSSTVQLLGAEKALFRHLKNKKSSCPKHGIIVNHPLVAQARQIDKGKAARHLASAIAMAAKVDYFNKDALLDNKYGKKLVEKVKKQLKR